jgi:hypothetical protein
MTINDTRRHLWGLPQSPVRSRTRPAMRVSPVIRFCR